MDSFDSIINLVALGLGVSFVPIRVLALYGRKHTLQRLPLKERFVRELVVVIRQHRKPPEHLGNLWRMCSSDPLTYAVKRASMNTCLWIGRAE